MTLRLLPLLAVFASSALAQTTGTDTIVAAVADPTGAVVVGAKVSETFIGAVPSPEMYAGDSSFGGRGFPIYDPASARQDANGRWIRDLFPGNRKEQRDQARVDVKKRRKSQIPKETVA